MVHVRQIVKIPDLWPKKTKNDESPRSPLMKKRRPLRMTMAGAAAASALLLTAGCASQDDSKNDATSLLPAGGGAGAGGLAQLPSQPAGGAPAGGGAGGGQLSTRQDTKLGSIVTDAQGLTLYRFDKDKPQPPQSNCNDACAVTWPPVMASEASTATTNGIGPLGQVRRADGKQQLTLGGWPVYRFSKDKAPGDTNGQGVDNGVWNALAQDGKKAGGGGNNGQSTPPQGRGSGQEANGDRRGSEGGEGRDLGLNVVIQPVIGAVVVDSNGRTLYQNGHLSRNSRAVCDARCSQLWTAVPPVNRSRVQGIDLRLITDVRLEDGSRQLAIGGHPVFWFNGDRTLGDIKGQGRDDFWALSSDGRINRRR
ncbi:hypothetical protein AB0C81_18565 [Streptomyces roseoverticillatus]|uniref:hypothetical protein n=1 Tax=Streptomyces roseoverticillatus TaxID=66429 RepID=UPI0033E1A769